MAQISVIVPVYKVEAYLDDCVKSILEQTFTDFELILVDDGSPDRCPQMCDEWAQRDSRIKVIHKTNGGLADARNAGIRAANGGYLAFVDSDDWVEPDFLEILHTGIENGAHDMVQCNFHRAYENGEEYPYVFQPGVYDKNAICEVLMPAMLHERLTQISSSRCNKLYKAETLKKAVPLCDDSFSMWEDYLLNYACLGFCNSVRCLETRFLYHYRVNRASMSMVYKREYKYHKIRFYRNMNAIARYFNVVDIPDIDMQIQKRWRYYIYECAISNWTLADRKKEIRQIAAELDRKCWRASLGEWDTAAKNVCLTMAYYGLTGPMLLLVDLMKKIKGIA